MLSECNVDGVIGGRPTQLTFGSPPIPNAISKEKDPVDTTGTFLGATERPSHMIDPFPNEVVIWSIACWRARSFLDLFSSLESLSSDLDFLLPKNKINAITTSSPQTNNKFKRFNFIIGSHSAITTSSPQTNNKFKRFNFKIGSHSDTERLHGSVAMSKKKEDGSFIPLDNAKSFVQNVGM